MAGFMVKILGLGLVLMALTACEGQEYPKLYEYFTEGGINSGLVAGNKEFRLNGKYIRLMAGAMHYFRIHPNKWRDRLRKLRAIGANAVETYVSWNLHEPRRGEFDFGNGTNDFSEFMNIRRFIQIAQEEDLLVILRPGPYICAEWEWGGFPSWLGQDLSMKVRQNYQPFLDRVKIFNDALLSELVDLQFTRGGSIIALQIENEYANFNPRSREYLKFVRQTYIDNEFDESVFFTADNTGWKEYEGGIPGVLQTANAHDVDNAFSQMLEIQPDMPLMVMEFYPGWLNHWFETTKGSRDDADYLSNMDKAFGKYNGSINLYMFHGGTNFGFMAGANPQGEPPYFMSDITSYDYDTLLSEAGDYAPKYNMTFEKFAEYENPKLWRPQRPLESAKKAYPALELQEYLTYTDIIQQIPSTHKVVMDKTVSMEELPFNGGNGQSYGYIIYRKTGPFGVNDRFKVSWPRDFAQFIIDGEQVDTGFTNEEPEYWINSIKEFPLTLSTSENHTVDVLIENIGRNNNGADHDMVQNKGISSLHQSKIEINDQEIQDVEIISAEFTNSWAKTLTNWRSPLPSTLKTPCLIRAKLSITGEEPMDTFLDMREWHKGIVFVNGFNIGRYWKVGPQQTLYIPADLLKNGENEIIIFEQLQASSKIAFLDTPILG